MRTPADGGEPQREGARATLRDVARASGVSTATVSFVLNGASAHTFPEATRERVRQAAAELGYVPNGIALALREGTSRIVVLNLDRQSEGSYSQSFIRGLDEELTARGHVLLVRHGRASPEADKRVLDAIAPAAVLGFGDVYLTGHELEDSGGGWENGMAAHVLTQFGHLADKGHRHVVLALPAEDVPLAPIRLRFANEVAEILGLAPVLPFVVAAVRADAATAVGTLLAEHPDVTAAAGFDDNTALRALAALQDLGLTAPGDLAVIGFDETAYSALSTPPLTTMLVDAEGHGRRAARLALGLDGSAVTTTPGRIIERGST